MTAEIARRAPSTIREATLRGCAVMLLHTTSPAGDGHLLLQLDREAQTWTRTLTGAELFALAKLNPDDGMPERLLPLLADLTLALTLVAGRWQMLTALGRTDFTYACTVAPPVPEELTTLGRLAAEVVAAIGAAR